LRLSLLLSMAFAWNASAAITNPDLARYFDLSYRNQGAGKIDFARLEHERPLSQEFLNRLTGEDILALDQELADQLYARLTAGSIPDGVYQGSAKIMDGSGIKNIVKIFTQEQSGGILDRLHLNPFTSDKITQSLNSLANTLWAGKHFYRGEKILRNVIPRNDTAARSLEFLVKGFSARSLKSQPVTIGGKEVQAWELFPAKVYCGESLIDARRESVIIDYAYGDRIAGYNEPIDFLATREGFYIRDEIRRVRPGLYLGKAYLNRMTFLTFVLQSEVHGVEDTQECWGGTQKRSSF
jgi:hypothetical protein